VPATHELIDVVLVHTLPPGHGEFDVDKPGQYEPTLQVCLEEESTQKLPAGHGDEEVEPAGQYSPREHDIQEDDPPCHKLMDEGKLISWATINVGTASAMLILYNLAGARAYIEILSFANAI
jgi:hypothetical protein